MLHRRSFIYSNKKREPSSSRFVSELTDLDLIVGLALHIGRRRGDRNCRRRRRRWRRRRRRRRSRLRRIRERRIIHFDPATCDDRAAGRSFAVFYSLERRSMYSDTPVFIKRRCCAAASTAAPNYAAAARRIVRVTINPPRETAVPDVKSIAPTIWRAPPVSEREEAPCST